MSKEENTKENTKDRVEKIKEITEEPNAVVVEESAVETTEEAAEKSAGDAIETDKETMAAELVQDETVDEKKSKKTLSKKMIGIIGGSIAGVLLLAYIAVASFYSNRFLMGTTVNGADCSGMTLKEVEDLMQAQVETYALTLNGAEGYSEQILGTEIDIKYDGVDEIQKAFEKQNSYKWIVALFQKNPIKANVSFTYDAEKLDARINALRCLKPENQKEAVSAKPIYQDGAYVIQPEETGTQIDLEKLNAAVHQSVDLMENSLDIYEKGCYLLPKYTSTSEEVIAARDGLNKCLQAKITYSLDGITVVVDKSQIENWLSVDQDMNIKVDEKKARAFTDTLGSKYNTPNKDKDLITPTGKKVKISGAILGRRVGSAADCEQLISEIKAGKVVTREPVLSQKPTSEDEFVWGNTYTEVDLSTQHMWHISNGNVVFECDVVTGSPGRNTPAGVFKILEKKRNKTLVGNIVPETGQPEYRTPVSYWARVTWSGIGFHDATWQPAFGGDLYLTRGSHGCINMSLADVAAYYAKISVGTPVIIHY